MFVKHLSAPSCRKLARDGNQSPVLPLATVFLSVLRSCIGSRVPRGGRLPEAYASAAVRHFQDAEELAAKSRFDGAGHLIGFAAECAIKHSVEQLRPNNQAPFLHFPEIIEKAKKLLQGRRKHSMFTLLTQAAFMAGWEVNQRYYDDGTVTKERYLVWRSDAARALGVAGLRRPTP